MKYLAKASSPFRHYVPLLPAKLGAVLLPRTAKRHTLLTLITLPTLLTLLALLTPPPRNNQKSWLTPA